MSQIIGSGAYGCVYKPALKCLNEDKVRQGISKLLSYQDSIDEYRRNQSILEQENESHHCRPDLTDFVPDKFSCPKGDLGMIVYPYYGDTLSAYVTKIKKNGFQKEDVDTLIAGISHVFLGVATLNGQGKYHRDLHTGNILVKDGIFRIIDYGVAVNLSKGDDPYVHELHGAWPPEGILLIKEDDDWRKYYDVYEAILVEEVLSNMKGASVAKIHKKMDVYGLGMVLDAINFVPVFKTKEFKSLISDMLELDPMKRIDIEAAQQKFEKLFA